MFVPNRSAVGLLCPCGWNRSLGVMCGWLPGWVGGLLSGGILGRFFCFSPRFQFALKNMLIERTFHFFQHAFFSSYLSGPLVFPKLQSSLLLLRSIPQYLPSSPPLINSVSFKWGKMACHTRVWQILVVTVAVIPAWAFLKSLRDKHIFGCRRQRKGRRGR